MIVLWSLRPDEELLFSGLSPEDIAPIVAELKTAGVQHRVEKPGTIWVESSQVDEMRMRVASKGLTGNRTLGYEILDRTDPSTPEFLQHVQTRRALEGELTRTIESLEEVRRARVHIAVTDDPDGADQAPSASVIVEAVPGARIAPDQVRGIRALVSASVADLEPDDVTVTDGSGRTLGGGNAALDATFEQLQVQAEVEGHLRRKATAMLEKVVGPSQAMVQITAEINFERVERSVESYNPLTSALRSEQKLSAGNSDESVLTQYEIDKTTERILAEPGAIRRLSVAVLVNGIETRNEGRTAYVERSYDELDRLEAIVRSAVGFSPERGDVLEIANLRFANPSPEEAGSVLPRWLFLRSLDDHLRSFLLLLSIGLVVWGLRQASVILSRAVEESRARIERDGSPETQKASWQQQQVRRKEMHAMATERPGEVASLLRGWIAGEKRP
jgi:flagellar M-ring protein FliF